MSDAHRRDLPDPSPRPAPPGAVTPPASVEPDEQPGAARPGGAGLGGRAAPPPPVHRDRRHKAVGWQSKDVLRTAALVIGFYVALKLLWFANQLVLVSFLGVLFGLAVSSGVDRLARFHIKRGIAAALIVLSFYGLLVGFGAWMAPTLREQSQELRRKLPEAADRVEEWMAKRQNGFLGMVLGMGNKAPGAGAAAPGATPPARGAQPGTAPAANPPTVASGDSAARPAQGAQPRTAQAQTGETAAPSPLGSLKDRLGSQVSGATRYLFPFLSSTIAVITGLFLITFLAVYIASDPDTYHDGLMHLFPRRSRKRAGEVLTAIGVVLRKWLVTQLIAMTVIGVVTTVALLLLGVKAAFALGLLAGLFEFIPTIGPIISAVPAIAMGFVDSPQKALYVTFLYIGIQFLENQLLIPMLMKGGVDIPPAMTVLSQALLAMVFGFLGLMVAVPMLAATMVAVKMLYVADVVGDPIEVMDEDGPGDDDD